MNQDDKNKNCTNERTLVLAPGAADASEGTVYLDEECTPCNKEVVGVPITGEMPGVEYKTYADQQPGEGFWSVAPGCGDISEGRVWVVKVKL